MNARQIHHIFPRSYLKTLAENSGYARRIKPFINSVVNVCLVTTLSNQIVGSKPPSEYLAELSNPDMESTLESHLIRGESYKALMDNNFEAFLTHRSRDIFTVLRTKYG